jgi:maleylpyruvate isomerase
VTRPDTDIAAASEAHAALLRTVAGLDDETARRPSLLPDWTIGHVLTHVARNADSHVHLLQCAERGEVGDQYPGGPAQRSADIDSGAGRPAADLLADVETACARLEAAWAGLPGPLWDALGRMGPAPLPMSQLPSRRWREVEIHHADLGLAFTWRDWSPQFVSADLPGTLAGLPDRLDAGERAALLAWLLGRAEQPDLAALQPWQVEQRRPGP